MREPQSGAMANSARLDAALAAAAAAAELIRASYQRTIAVRTKADGSPVTEADVASEQAIRGILLGRFPDDGFFGEETAADRLDADDLWIVGHNGTVLRSNAASPIQDAGVAPRGG